MQKQLLFLFGVSFIIGCAKQPSLTSYELSDRYEAINKTYMVGKNGVVLRKSPNIYTQICNNIRVGDTVYVYGRFDFDWYVVRRNGRRYFAPASGLYNYAVWRTKVDYLQPGPSTQSLAPYSSPNQTIHTGLIKE